MQSFPMSDAILDSDVVAVMVLHDDRLRWATRALHRLLGYPSGEMLGLAATNVFGDRPSYQATMQAFRDGIQQLGRHSGLARLIRKDGTTGWFAINIAPLAPYADALVAAVDESSAPGSSVGRIEDEEARYRMVLEDQTEVISRFRGDGTFVYVNDVYCRIFGKVASDLIGHRWQPSAHPEDVPVIEAKLREMTPENPVVVIENRVYLAGNDLRWMQFVNRGFYDPAGTLIEVQSVGRDITRLKQTESELRESDERLELALEGSELVLWDWNIVQRTLTMGKRWFELLGYEQEEWGTGERELMALINAEDRERVDQALASHMNGHSPVFESRHRLRHKSGHWVLVEARGKVTRRDGNNAPLRMVGTLLNITQRKRLNDEGIALLKRIESLIRDTSSPSPPADESLDLIGSLTKRERQILKMIADGMTSSRIGTRLDLATPTVMSHRRNLMAKLGLHSTAELTRFAVKHGLLTGDK